MSNKALIEAALFMSEDPLSLDSLKKITEMDKRELRGVLEEIGNELKIDSRGLELAITPEGYHLKVKDNFIDKVAHLAPHSDLSDGMLRTLGLVAVRQPIAQSQIVKIQGNKSYGYLSKLEKKGLISSEKSGRTKVIRTTPEFEKYFGKSVGEIQELFDDNLVPSEPEEN
jgi:segregation and condensation protein B